MAYNKRRGGKSRSKSRNRKNGTKRVVIKSSRGGIRL